MSDATAAVDAGENEGNTSEADHESTTEAKTFSQSEVDRIVADRLKREKSKYEKESQAAAEKARLATLSESEQAIELARSEARAEVRKETATVLAQGRLKAVLTGLAEDPDAVIEDLDLNRFITEDHTVDEEAVERIKTKYQKLLGNRGKQRSAAQPGRSTQVKTGSARDDFADFIQSNF